MINTKWGIVAAGVGFVLAFVFSLLLGHAGLLTAFLRGLGFAALFFILGAGAWALINAFIPELLFTDTGGRAEETFPGATTGSRVNITVGDTSGAAVPERSGGAHSDSEVENFDDLVSGKIKPRQRDIDENPVNGYNEATGEFASVPDTAIGSTGSDDDFSMNFGSFFSGSGIEGLESLGDSFGLSPGGGDSAPATETLPERKTTGNKPTPFEGDFNPKEIAAGIRTVLEKDKRG